MTKLQINDILCNGATILKIKKTQSNNEYHQWIALCHYINDNYPLYRKAHYVVWIIDDNKCVVHGTGRYYLSLSQADDNFNARQ